MTDTATTPDTPQPDTPKANKPKPGIVRRILRWFLRGLGVFVSLAALYTMAIWILGSIAVNQDFKEAAAGIEIMIQSNGVHTDFYLPVKTKEVDWRQFAPLEAKDIYVPDSSFALIGWGDRGFFLDTETWDDLTVGTALGAVFWPTSSVMHLYYQYSMPRETDQAVRISLHPDQYRELVTFIKASFKQDDQGKPVLIAGRSYSKSDVFYVGVGSYHLLNTCNNWANRALDAAGVTTPVWSPFDGALFKHLPR